MTDVLPSPKFQFQPVIVPPLERSLNETVKGAVPLLMSELKSEITTEHGVGPELTVMFRRLLLTFPHEFTEIRFTEYVPGLLKVWMGFWVTDVLPSPKFQFQPVIVPPLERSLN